MSIPIFESMNPGILIIRADADSYIGTGHVMRCIALAQGWQKHGGSVKFLANFDCEEYYHRIQIEGFETVKIKNRYPNQLDLDQTKKEIEDCGVPPASIWLVLDGYHFSDVYQKALKSIGVHLVVVDDNADKPFYHADIILNHNFHSERVNYKCNPNTVMLTGPRYALLRKEFLEKRNIQQSISNLTTHRLLITMGGADTNNVSAKILQAISSIQRKDIEVKVILGPANTNADKLRKKIGHLDFRCQIISSSLDMATEMQWANMAITAGGTTCLELAVMGIPFLIIITAVNQEESASSFAEQTAAINLGWHSLLRCEEIGEAINNFIEDGPTRKKISLRCRELIDGQSIERIIEAIHPSEIKLHLAVDEDSIMVWHWANDEVSRAVSFSTETIPFESHKVWFERYLRDDSLIMYIVSNKYGIPLGQVRFEIYKYNAVVSVNIAPTHRALGIGHRALFLASKMCLKEKKLNQISALIKPDNTASLRAFERAGYFQIGHQKYKGEEAILMVFNHESSKTALVEDSHERGFD